MPLRKIFCLLMITITLISIANIVPKYRCYRIHFRDRPSNSEIQTENSSPSGIVASFSRKLDENDDHDDEDQDHKTIITKEEEMLIFPAKLFPSRQKQVRGSVEMLL